MCLIHGLADGRWLNGDGLVSEDLLVDAEPGCTCGGGRLAAEHGDAGGVSRRELVRRSVAASAGLALGGGLVSSAVARAQQPAAGSAPSGDRLVMLGVNGGPVLSKAHSQPALMLVVGGVQYLVDCGGDTARQMVNAGTGFTALREVFLTHHHIDHTGGYPELALLGWTYPGPLQALGVWGPPPIVQMQHHLEQMYGFGTHLFEVGIGSPKWAPMFHAHAVKLPRRAITKVMEDDRVLVHATRVFHGPEVHDAYAYRFDLKSSGRSIVFSGDTAGPNHQLIRLAHDADVLVHESQMNSAIPQIVAQADPSMQKALTHHLETTHTNVVDLPRVAKAANAKRLVMCHYTPSFIPAAAFLAAAKAAAASIGYTGEITAPTELDTIAL